MGIAGFWELVDRAGVEKSLPQWATDHLKEHKRPLRIAVDAAHWQFKNVSDAQEAAIQQQSPGSHPREKAILKRLLPLMRLGIHMVFIFDGEQGPQIKRGSKRYGQRGSTTALIKNTLDHILVPWLQAPGEAEAECALLQQQGLVDAVWSEDGDCFMFGSTVVIRDLRDTNNHKSKEHARIFDMRDIRRLKAGLYNKKSVACFAMLTGCDYAPSGLLGCGTRLAQELVKDGGLVESFWCIQMLPQANQWRTRLENSIEKITSLTDLHFNKDKSNIMTFPNLEALKNCRSPAVSTSDTLKRLPFLQGEWYGTHTTNSLATTIPWMQQYYFSRMTTIWWIRQFTPMVLNQRLLKGEVQALDLVAKVAQKRKESPTSSIELDPCNVFPGIENIFIESEGNLLANGGVLEDSTEPSNIAFGAGGGAEVILPDLLKLQEQILAECQANKIRTPAIEPRGNSRIGQGKSPTDSRHSGGLISPLLVHKPVIPATASPSGRSMTKTATPATPSDIRNKRLAKLGANRILKETPRGTGYDGRIALGYGSAYSLLDDDDISCESASAKKRGREEANAEDVRTEPPGMRARRMLLEVELDSSQDSIRATKAKGDGRCKPAVVDDDTDTSGARMHGGGTVDDPSEVS
ncbi:hypothetical protein CNYM01_09745 [Colletotrichum nymphaeae SA-01]|uniref:XPG-I domain-containing protein n=1 Tax=Colletotrichum nymphaeae SA-01 TaxID=1460502 RepID=A0A135URG5_9PEZI|nr:hypothetical protein CNYM01_09745 [Colletotrichum nymphaeae SA-01]